MAEKKKRRSENTLAYIAYQRIGIRKAGQVLAFIAAWGIALEMLEKESITMDEYGEWWEISRATAFRDQQLFRRAFPEFESPEPIWHQVRSQIDAKGMVKERERKLGALMVGNAAVAL